MSYVDEVANDSPSALWLLDEASGTAVAPAISTLSGTHNAGVTAGAAGLRLGARNLAASYNGSTGVTTFNDNAVFASAAGASGQFTAEAVIKPSSLPAGSWFLSKNGSSLHEWAVRLDSNGAVHCNIWTPAGANIMSKTTSAGLVAANRWTYVAVTYNRATPRLAVCINGTIEVSTTIITGSNITDNAGVFTVGRRGDNSGAFFPGLIQAVAYYPTALSDATLLRHYKSFLRAEVTY